VSATWPCVALAGLGAFHGLNPAMGWLFAVARGLQGGGRDAVLRSLIPIAAGHALSVAIVIVAIGVLRAFVGLTTLEVGAAIALIGFGLYRLFARHRGRAGMQVSGAQLVMWSFLMATAHGAGLMLIPVLLGMPADAPHAQHAHMAAIAPRDASVNTALAALGIHTVAMLATAGVVAVVVHDWVGVAFLRRGWINLDFVWVAALIGAGVLLLVMALW
jgi:hypothetical protein